MHSQTAWAHLVDSVMRLLFQTLYACETGVTTLVSAELARSCLAGVDGDHHARRAARRARRSRADPGARGAPHRGMVRTRPEHRLARNGVDSAASLRPDAGRLPEAPRLRAPCRVGPRADRGRGAAGSQRIAAGGGRQRTISTAERRARLYGSETGLAGTARDAARVKA